MPIPSQGQNLPLGIVREASPQKLPRTSQSKCEMLPVTPQENGMDAEAGFAPATS